MEPVLIEKNLRETYRIGWEVYQGNRFIDFRIYFDDGSGELKPTKKGMSIKASAIPEIVQALEAMARGGAQ